MAGQPIEQDNRDRLVNFNHRLMTEHVGKSLIINNASNSVDIAQKDLRERVAMQIPQALLDELHLGEFHFRPVIEDALVSLYEGSSRPRDDNVNIDESEVLIEIINRVPSRTRNSHIPIFTRIAARHPLANQAVQVAYDCQDGNLESVILTASPRELPSTTPPELVVHLPESILEEGNGYLITKAMRQQYESDEHRVGIRFDHEQSEEPRYRESLESAGLHVALHRDKIVFVLAASGGDLQSKMISVPRRLESVTRSTRTDTSSLRR